MAEYKKVVEKYGIIQRKAFGVGLFSYFLTLLGGINFCVENGLIPIVDMKTHDNIYQKGNGKINSWELFWEQPVNIGLEGVGEKVQIVDCNSILKRPNLSMDFVTNGELLSYWHELCQKYVKLNQITSQYVQNCINRYFPGGIEKETLGVLCRGTDYINTKPYRHPIQPDVYMMIDKVKEVRKRLGYKYIFLVTEDHEIYNQFAIEFSTALIAPSIFRYENTGNVRLAVFEGKTGYKDMNQKALDYLASIYMLTRCRALVAGRTSGSVSALILSGGKYEYSYIWDIGVYGVTDQGQ